MLTWNEDVKKEENFRMGWEQLFKSSKQTDTSTMSLMGGLLASGPFSMSRVFNYWIIVCLSACEVSDEESCNYP